MNLQEDTLEGGRRKSKKAESFVLRVMCFSSAVPRLEGSPGESEPPPIDASFGSL
jgi:hypothetical protein